MKPTASVYGRLCALSKLHGRSWEAFQQTIRAVLERTWCAQTACTEPNAKPWSSERPTIGQADVTACYLARHVFDGDITMVRLRGGEAHFVVWTISGCGSSVLDFCAQDGKPVWELVVTFTPEEFLADRTPQAFGQDDTEISRRLAIFHERFMSALAALEQEQATA